MGQTISGEKMTHNEWITRNYKADRLSSRGKEYEKTLRESRAADLEKDGFDCISHFDSNSGELMIYGSRPEWYHGDNLTPFEVRRLNGA